MNDVATLTLPELVGDGFETLRRPARDQFLKQGWPTRRNEAYKYTDLSGLARHEWPQALCPGTRPKLPAAVGERHLWVDGHPTRADGDVSSVRLLSKCARSPSSELSGLLGQLAPSGDPVVALNTALFDHGAWIRVPKDTAPAKPLELTYAVGERDAVAAMHSRLVLDLECNSRLVLIERHAGSDAETLATRVAEISLASGAQLLHIRLNEAGAGTRLLGHTTVRTGENARYQCLNLDLGARLSRETFQVDLIAEGASAILHGLALLDGKRHADADVRILHQSGHTRSRQRFRGVLDGRSRSVYTGRVRVAEHAQKSDSAQESANLLLSPKAEVDTRPQLEIYADDVVCNHGAATGAIDADALFYLRSRGLDAATARRMVAYGFASEILSGIENADLRRALGVLLAGHMQAPREVLEWL